MAARRAARSSVTVLFRADALDARRDAANGALGVLADSLAHDLEPVLARDLFIPPEKARMTRRGGRCEVDGTLLEFDPFSPRVHRCPQCGRKFDDETHYRWWIMGYQLWLAERAVHAAALFALRGDVRHRDFAHAVLDGYVDRYLRYPNADNVLGPTRPFFSTYLESIWLLQLIVALDLLEMAGAVDKTSGERARDRVIEPSARLIAGYDEGLSNRQVWNNAALLAATRILDRPPHGGAFDGPSGLVAHLTSGLLSDGTWYEGENYHLFAHRGLWYGVTTAESAGVALDPRLVRRFDEAFATPFVTALPDFTFPSRRDSQYGVSLRQWRFAELAELGLVRQPNDGRLTGALATLYDGSMARRDTGRSRSTAEAERNTLATALDRSDLGWRSLLFASPTLPSLAPSSPTSVVLRSQGLAILRREEGRLYAALDYGHSGAGHGHPDRLNVILVRGNDRWLDDVGTGSYVDPSLHWYRSTLAHNAPLVNGRSQERVHGTLVAFEDRGEAGWVRAFVDDVAPGVRLERTLVVMPNYLIDELTWESDHDVEIDLPFHVDGTLAGIGPWVVARPTGGTALEDGFGFLHETETATPTGAAALHAKLAARSAHACVFVSGPHAWWRATAYGPPGSPPARFHFVRVSARRGRIVTVWDLDGSIADAQTERDVIRVSMRDGSEDEHRADPKGWHIVRGARDEPRRIDLAGFAEASAGREKSKTMLSRQPPTTLTIDADPRAQALLFALGETQYHRSELSWSEAGKPHAMVAIRVDGNDLVVSVDVHKKDVYFAPPRDSNPLDNEPPDTNSDGVQFHIIIPNERHVAHPGRELTYLMVPEVGSGDVRVTARASGEPPPPARASWRAIASGYSLHCALSLAALGLTRGQVFQLGVVVNDMSADRERRRGQLVLGGTDGEFVYLRGDRLAADRHLPFMIADV